METKINTAEILKNVPIGTKLYSPLFGNVYLTYIGEMFITVRHHSTTANFHHNGRLYNYEGTEPMLFPSREMRDWSKFSWKKGDVLTNNSGFKIFFDKWVNDDYTKFFGKIKLLGDSHCYDAAFYNLVPEEKALEFIKSVEEINNGKLNRETLEIEKSELKDGDIVVTDAVPSMLYSKCIFILKGDWNIYKNRANSYIFYNVSNNHICFNIVDKAIRDRDIRFATEEEKQQLFDALAKEGKAWDDEKKQIVDLKPKYEFKPMDLCLMKYIGKYNNRGWELCQYAYTEHRVSSSGEQRDFYHAVGGEIYAECIPYKGNEHLLGTKKSK